MSSSSFTVSDAAMLTQHLKEYITSKPTRFHDVYCKLVPIFLCSDTCDPNRKAEIFADLSKIFLDTLQKNPPVLNMDAAMKIFTLHELVCAAPEIAESFCQRFFAENSKLMPTTVTSP